MKLFTKRKIASLSFQRMNYPLKQQYFPSQYCLFVVEILVLIQSYADLGLLLDIAENYETECYKDKKTGEKLIVRT